ncbi:prepilin-type N-terminal cleavage/methylation domain-containing protein [Candidatus Kaiserbacteria bacterium]|nr:prepilin-type N-terminal cleavage/methylation domain-containing protein [Candidatus Kaiserbacteria bacterium]MCB9811348.1 prepilin-type N-terminal cleavage/methylation domain-containing protein [Candidatus Nomurabacteria bacterium]
MFMYSCTRNNHIQHSATSANGFSLIELLVSMAIYTMVVTMAIGTVLVLIDANAKAQNMETIMTNITFVLENMTREIRTGRSLYCMQSGDTGGIGTLDTQDCDSNYGQVLSLVEGGSSLTGGNANPRIAYRYNETDMSIERRVSDGPWVRLSSDDAIITGLYFNVYGTDVEDDVEQPTVRIWVSGFSGELGEVRSQFSVQTTVTQQIADFDYVSP